MKGNQMKYNYTKHQVVEFIAQGTSYIGEFSSFSEKDGIVNFEKVMRVDLTPMPVPNDIGGSTNFVMVPKMNIINYYSLESAFKFNDSDINYIAVVSGNEFIELYKKMYSMYEKEKIKEGSNISIVSP
jgi:hypothetical protein